MFVFSLPWEYFVTIDLLGSVSRVIGVAAISIGVFAIAIGGRLRRPALILSLAFAFTLLNLLSMFWTIDAGATFVRVVTYGQLLGLAWLIWEFARNVEEQQALMVAYCAGAYLCIADLLRNFLAGKRIHGSDPRYSGLGFNANDLGLMLALGIPMAWHMYLNRKGIVRLAAASYLPLAVVGILLTASRSGFLCSIVALSIVPLTLPRRSVRSIVMVAIVLLAAAGAAVLIVPQSSWDRILTTSQELRAGTLGGRGPIWAAGLQIFQDHMVLGAGAGAFESSVEPVVGPKGSAHNVFLAILVEQGIVGMLAFVALLAACGWRVYLMRRPQRAVWTVVACVWLVGSMSLGWQYSKITWLLFGLIAAEASGAQPRALRSVTEESHDGRIRAAFTRQFEGGHWTRSGA